jgi:translation initiation factor IF-1
VSKKDDMMRLDGRITELLPNATFRIQLDVTKAVIVAYIGGKLRKHRINILLGDKVVVEMSPYDLTRGRVVYRK